MVKSKKYLLAFVFCLFMIVIIVVFFGFALPFQYKPEATQGVRNRELVKIQIHPPEKREESEEKKREMNIKWRCSLIDLVSLSLTLLSVPLKIKIGKKKHPHTG